MTLVATQVRVAGTGELFIAPVGTAAPTNTSTSLNVAFKGLGYTQEDGVTIGRSTDRTEITAWQSTAPVRYIYNNAGLTIATAMLQSNDDVANLWWGGGSFATNTTEFKSDLPTVPTGVQRAVVVEWTDGSVKNRLYVPKAEVTDTGDVTLGRTAATAFQITFTALAPDAGSVMATWFTADANFDPAT